MEEEKCNEVCVKTKLPGKKLPLNSGHNFPQSFEMQSAQHFTLTNRVSPAAVSVKRMMQEMHVTIEQTGDSQQPFLLLHDMGNKVDQDTFLSLLKTWKSHLYTTMCIFIRALNLTAPLMSETPLIC